VGTAAEVEKKPNFIQFYKLSRLTWRRSFCISQAPKEAIQDGGSCGGRFGGAMTEGVAQNECLAVAEVRGWPGNVIRLIMHRLRGYIYPSSADCISPVPNPATPLLFA
jgi:hypothetical protein